MISSCHYLQKLSLAGLHASKPYFEPSILLNNQSLKVLDLNGCKGLSLDSIKTVVSNCLELTEVNFDNTKLDTEAIEHLCTNLTVKIEKLSLFRLKVTDENVKVLVQNCKKIIELDLGSTAVTEISKQFLLSFATVLFSNRQNLATKILLSYQKWSFISKIVKRQFQTCIN